jgi:presenilin-like A22 family membrane protease
MFKNLSDKKINFSLIVPAKLKDYLIKLNFVSTDNQFMFLGTGDIVLPLIFTISCLHSGWRTALFAGAGSIFGFILLYTIFINQKDKNPMPGLPPLVLGCLLGYFLSFI